MPHQLLSSRQLWKWCRGGKKIWCSSVTLILESRLLSVRWWHLTIFVVLSSTTQSHVQEFTLVLQVKLLQRQVAANSYFKLRTWPSSLAVGRTFTLHHLLCYWAIGLILIYHPLEVERLSWPRHWSVQHVPMLWITVVFVKKNQQRGFDPGTSHVVVRRANYCDLYIEIYEIQWLCVWSCWVVCWP